MEETGIPQQNSLLKRSRQDLDDLQREKTNLDIQVAAIKAMAGDTAYAKACEDHLEIKIRLDDQIAKARKAVQKYRRTLNGMVKTQHALAMELNRANQVRKDITNSDMYKPNLNANTGDKPGQGTLVPQDCNNNIIVIENHTVVSRHIKIPLYTYPKYIYPFTFMRLLKEVTPDSNSSTRFGW